ncbi:MAG: BtrH N-terminal domain-containing protein [Chloroflexi bacterium]|nr:BtrH N-terminal domain-containing protein [Chloroflexota bacterium]
MKAFVSGFEHKTGVHCGSTAMSDLLRFYGHDYSEGLSFGLGAALAFYYVRGSKLYPTRQVMGRTLTLEPDLCRHHGIPHAWHTEEDSARAWEAVREQVALGKPVLLQTDLSKLDYYNTRTPFTLHRVLLVGYDDATETAYLADTDFPGLQEVSYDSLRRARDSKIPPFPTQNAWMILDAKNPTVPLPEAMRAAIIENARRMLKGDRGYGGIENMFEWADELPFWPDQTDDWVWCVRFAYQVIERRGTGGGFFRRLYAQFLQEVETQIPAAADAHLADEMSDIARNWRDLGMALKQISEEQDPAALESVAPAARKLALREQHFYGHALKAVGSGI